MRRIVSRFLLVGLVGAVLAFVIHQVGSPGDAIVTIDGIKAESDPEHEAFRVDETVRVTIEAAGSFEGGEADTALAAHGWIVDRETGEVVWQMRPARRPERGTFVLMRDTVDLAPGVYDAYFAGLGMPMTRTVRPATTLRERLSDALSGGGKGWVGDAARWRLIVRFAPGEGRDRAEREYGDPPEPEDLIWGTGPARSSKLYEVALRASEPVRVRLDALFEGAGVIPADSAYLVSAEGDTLWAARPAASRHAGGSLRNRRQTDTLSLAPGQYRAVFRTDDSHAFRDWDANPPWEPWRWGLRITPADSASRAGAFAPVDILNDLPRIAEMECVDEPNASREVRFEVLQPLDVTIVAVGEFVGGDGYDYARLFRGGETIWDMEDADLRSAGGASKNRRADETLSLSPGTYTLRYVTDSSHHCRDYNSSKPDLEEFWGVVLLSADGREAGDRVRILEDARPAAFTVPANALVDISRVGDDREEVRPFRVAETTDVCVLSVGEVSDSDRYDWGQVTTASGQTLFELTHANSSSAGGHSYNRRAVAVLTLQPGSYTARYQTDGSHAYGSWSDPPDTPELWGLQIWPAPPGAASASNPYAACLTPPASAPPPGPPPPPPSPEPEADVFDVVEQEPELIGGIEGLERRVEYPEAARRAGVDGTVYVQFVVEADGDVSRAVCARTPDPRLCDAAIEAVEGSEFRPGMQRGRPVDVRFTLPVRFALR